jgi:hypothetical protein
MTRIFLIILHKKKFAIFLNIFLEATFMSKIAWTKFTEWEYKRDMYLKNIVKTENTFLCCDVRSSLKQLFVYQGQKKVHLFRPSMSFLAEAQPSE